jgi:hypothetical protein
MRELQSACPSSGPNSDPPEHSVTSVAVLQRCVHNLFYVCIVFVQFCLLVVSMCVISRVNCAYCVFAVCVCGFSCAFVKLFIIAMDVEVRLV